MVPINLRDGLYRLFVESLEQPDAAAAFARESGVLGTSKAERAYLRDRRRRFLEVLRRWRQESAAAPDGLAEEVKLARLLFKAGLYFDTHEFLEPAWRRSTGQLKIRLQGFIQLAAALHKLELDPKATQGARYLTRRGFEKLRDL